MDVDPPSDFEGAPSLELKKSQIIGIGVALTHAQDGFLGGLMARSLRVWTFSS